MTMSNTKKYYRTVVEVVVLSDTPYEELFPHDNLAFIAREISDGDCVGAVTVTKQETTDGATMAKALYAAGSEPSFFMLDNDGNEVI